jgi:hypothetical protein
VIRRQKICIQLGTTILTFLTKIEPPIPTKHVEWILGHIYIIRFRFFEPFRQISALELAKC